MTRYNELLKILATIRGFQSDTYLGLKFMVASKLDEYDFLNENYHFDVTIKQVEDIYYVSKVEYDVTNAHISFEYVPDFKKSENSVMFVPLDDTFKSNAIHEAVEKIKRVFEEKANILTEYELKADTDISKNKNT